MDDPDAHDLIGHLFALITARLEDAATLAANGQSADLTQTSRLIADIRREIDDALSCLGAAEAVARAAASSID
ncbi:hypothetical protein [Sphingobium phenoxybenzoativorans]|uniref:hypothetical protein n=1 Tax=Sphingobium phenoxybenzoativorans TaxID=1592790 RepID=UPI001112EE5D|nr:hypothetical protein [Sphingobium phenoxybenzoativorans]